jgi:hypothetical protein
LFPRAAVLTNRPPWPAGYHISRSITARVPTTESDSHDDFKPKYRAEERDANSVEDQIKKDIQEHSVFLYMKVCASRGPHAG